MVKSFGDLKHDLYMAGEYLRSFTLGKPGVSKRDGAAGICHVVTLIDRMEEGFASGEHATEARWATMSARNQILAANARLALLLRR